MSVCVPIEEGYFIRSDKFQWIVSKEGKLDKHGKKQWDNFSYHTTLDSAIKSLAQRLLRNCDAVTLTQLLTHAETIRTALSLAHRTIQEIEHGQ